MKYYASFPSAIFYVFINWWKFMTRLIIIMEFCDKSINQWGEGRRLPSSNANKRPAFCIDGGGGFAWKTIRTCFGSVTKLWVHWILNFNQFCWWKCVFVLCFHIDSLRLGWKLFLFSVTGNWFIRDEKIDKFHWKYFGKKFKRH